MSTTLSNTRLLRLALVMFLLTALVLTLAFAMRPAGAQGTTPTFINEFHYDNEGTDQGEFIEVAGPAGTDLTGWRLVLYNGNGGTVYSDETLNGFIPDQQSGFGTFHRDYPSNGIQNGSPDGIALVDDSGIVIQFLSYEGSFTAVGGPADGMTSVDVGVGEDSSTPIGNSLQLEGTGMVYDDFSWSGPQDDSPGAVNSGQVFTGGGGNSPIIPNCGDPIVLQEGEGAEQGISATDSDGTVVEAVLTNVNPPTTGISLTDVVPATGVGGTLFGTVAITDTLPADSYTVDISFANDDAEPQTASCSLSVTINSTLPIYEIQGDGQFSPYQGQTVVTFGIVTMVSDAGFDMWIQDPNGDGNPATSDGIFVDDRNPSGGPQVGDHVIITGEVEELQFGNALPLTRIDDTVVLDVVSSGNPLPLPVPLVDLPNESIQDGIDFWEPLEGMLVSLADGLVVAPTSGFGEFGVLTIADVTQGSGFFRRSKQIILQDLGANVVDYNPERIVVDDQTLGDAIVTRPGDRIMNLIGVVDYTFGMYKIQPAEDYDLFAQGDPRMPASRRSGPAGDFVVTSFNVENLFDLLNNPDKADEGSTPSPADLEIQLTKLALAIEEELLLPEIIVVQETENFSITQELGDRVNAATGTAYVSSSFETSDARGIEVGFLWDSNRVNLLDVFQLDDSIVPGVSDAFGPNSASPGREPLVGYFDVGDGPNNPLIIVGNHFKSKSGDDPIYGVNWPPIRVTEAQRKMQAQVVRDYVDQLLQADPWAQVIVAGDLNDFAFGEPGEGPDHPLAILEGAGGGIPLVNLIFFEDEYERFSFVFDGNSQVLDHMLISPGMWHRFAAVDILHFNAGYPDDFSGDPTTTIRASDHDALEGRFRSSRFGAEE